MTLDPSALAARGLSETDPRSLEAALRAALETMEPLAWIAAGHDPERAAKLAARL